MANIVNRIYKMFLDGYGTYKITEILTNDGIAILAGKRRRYTKTIKSILQNEKYKGDALLQKYYTKDYYSKKLIRNKGEVQQYYIKGSHEPIISPEVSEILDKTIFDTTGLETEAAGLREELFLLTKKIEDLSLRNARSIDRHLWGSCKLRSLASSVSKNAKCLFAYRESIFMSMKCCSSVASASPVQGVVLLESVMKKSLFMCGSLK